MTPGGFPLSLPALALIPSVTLAAALQTKPDLRFKLHSGVFITVPCQIHARASLTCLLDTGTWPTVVDRSCAAGHELRAGQRDTLSLVDHVVPVSSAVVPRFGLAEITMESLPVSVRDLSELGALIGVRADVILGLDVLRQASFCLDFESHSVSFETGSPMRWSVPMLDFGPDPIVVEAEIDGMPVHLLVDAGAPGTVLFPDRVKNRFSALAFQAPESDEIRAMDSLLPQITLQQMRIGGWSRKRVKAVTVADPPAGLPPVDGLLSLTTLGCDKICFDFSRGSVSWR